MTFSRVLTDLGSHTSWKVSYSHIFKAQSPLEPCCSYPFHSSPRFQKILSSTTVEWKLKLQPCMHAAADVATDMLAVTFLFTHWKLGSRCNFAIKPFFQINDCVLLCWVQSIHVCVHGRAHVYACIQYRKNKPCGLVHTYKKRNAQLESVGGTMVDSTTSKSHSQDVLKHRKEHGLQLQELVRSNRNLLPHPSSWFYVVTVAGLFADRMWCLTA